MVKKIKFSHYRKFKDDSDFEFFPNINIISGSNGTCKTSLLHIITNSYQSVKTKNPRIQEGYIPIFNKLAEGRNLKLESLTKGDKKYVNPAYGTTGPLYSTQYHDEDYELHFRRHNTVNSDDTNLFRFSVKPEYKAGKNERLPERPTIYLGLSRLYPFGEYNSTAENSNTIIPKEFQDKLKVIWDDLEMQYHALMRLKITPDDKKLVSENLEGIRTRASFTTASEGIDSNTISSGQDNVYVILKALACLRFYFEGIKPEESYRDVESILLIDEFDATLHPEIQIKLLNHLNTYSVKYRIQIVFTTHSLTLLEEALKNKDINVLYLLDEGLKVRPLSDITETEIEMYLKNCLRDDIFDDKKIPVYTEDAEARIFVKAIFEEYKRRKNSSEITQIIDSFHLVEANLGEENLRNIFSDNFSSSLSKSAIAILDGDQTLSELNKKNNIITLPQPNTIPKDNTPERILIQYSFELFEDIDKKYDDFWNSQELMQLGFTRAYFESNIKPSFQSFIEFDNAPNDSEESQKGIRRKRAKKLFQDNIVFLKYVLRYWVMHEDNQKCIYKFLQSLNISFKKIAHIYGKYIHYWDLNK